MSASKHQLFWKISSDVNDTATLKTQDKAKSQDVIPQDQDIIPKTRQGQDK